jgi:hypothetical protein
MPTTDFSYYRSVRFTLANEGDKDVTLANLSLFSIKRALEDTD